MVSYFVGDADNGTYSMGEQGKMALHRGHCNS